MGRERSGSDSMARGLKPPPFSKPPPPTPVPHNQGAHQAPQAHPAPVHCPHFKDKNEEVLQPRLNEGPQAVSLTLYSRSIFQRQGWRAGDQDQKVCSDAPWLHLTPSLLLQPARPPLQVQRRAVQAVRRPEWGSLRAVPPPHGWAALPLLPAGVLEGP